MLVHAVVVAGDRARAHVHAGADVGVADIGQVVRLAVFAQHALLDLDKIAHVAAVAKLRAGAQAGIRTHARIAAHLGLLQVAEGFDMRARSDADVAQHAMRPDAHAIGQGHLAFEHAAHVDEHIAAAAERTAHVKARGIGQRHAGFELAAGLLTLPAALELGLLDAAVHAQRFPGRAGLGRAHRHVIGHGQSDHIGQVVLALGIVVVDAGQPVLELRGRRAEDAGVDFLDQALGFRGVLVLDDAAHAALAVAHDAAIAGGIGQHLGQHGGALAAGVQQALQGLGLHQRHVAVQHQGHVVLAVSLEQRHGLLHRVTRALLRLLQHEVQIVLAFESLFDAIRAMADHDDDARRLQLARAVQHMGQHGFAGQRVQHFGEIGLHAFTQSGGKNHYIKHKFYIVERRSGGLAAVRCVD
ncbi:hypothetical protein D3C85_941190 [compost metagenome]